MKEQTWQQWARAVGRDPGSPSLIKKGSIGALTGTDFRALDAFVACLTLYRHTGERRILEAARVVLEEMQESTRWIARELIAFVLDWGDRERLWSLVRPETQPTQADEHGRVCGARYGAP
jgi:hypothetical protein